MIQRPCGWKPERPGSALVMGARKTKIGSYPTAHALQRPDWRLNQHGESCFGHVAAQWLWMLKGVQGSPYLPWWAARLHDTPGSHLFDLGVTASAGLAGMRDTGVCSWDLWNPDMPGFDINAEPPGIAVVAAQKANADATILLGSGNDLVSRICYEISQDHPCAIVVAVDDVVDGYDGGVLGRERGPSRGYHIMPLDRYRMERGTYYVGGINSWAFWGEKQRFWLAPERVAETPFALVCRGFS